jgi:large conductance mechanosensitive channel
MGMLKEFKQFAMKGNVVDLAVGIIIGAAFGKIVSSVVADVIMPPIGMLLGGINFTDIKIKLGESIINGEAKIVTVNIGTFIQTIFDFLIVAFAIFMLIKAINAASKKKEEEVKPVETPKQEILLTEIRDLLKK